MKELKNESKGIISEEALDQIAAGMDIDLAKLKRNARNAGILILSAATLAAMGIGGKALIDRHRSPTKRQTSGFSDESDYSDESYYDDNYGDSYGGVGLGDT